MSKSIGKVLIVAVVVAAAGGILWAKQGSSVPEGAPTIEAATSPSTQPEATAAIPKLLDLGADKCIPCKMMKPILDGLREEYSGRMDVEFVDVWKDPAAAEKHAISVIPTQIFFGADGKELRRHEGFISKEEILATWTELGVKLGASAAAPAEFARLEPAVADSRAKDTICYLCDGDIHPKTRTVLKTGKGDVAFCSPHCYFITYSSMVETKPALENVTVTDWPAGTLVPAASANYVYGVDAVNRPTVKAFADQAACIAEQQAAGGNVVEWSALQDKELATRCGFCDRAVYPEDACAVNVEGLRTWGCCTMCALGVAARLQKDIEVTAKDALTGEALVVKTFGGHVAELNPASMVAWAGSRKDAEGKVVSTGCFKQAFFANEANLKTWVDAHPAATGRMVTIEQALTEKMKLTPQQISKACKIGECTPK